MERPSEGSMLGQIPKSATAEEKIEHIVRNSACVLRIGRVILAFEDYPRFLVFLTTVPTRSTSYSHLRDGFMRTIQARMQLCRKREQLTPEEEFGVQSPLRKFKSMFPSTPLTKHTPLDILVPAPEANHPRTLIVRDLGSVQNDWLAREFILGYFEADGISPPVSATIVLATYALTK